MSQKKIIIIGGGLGGISVAIRLAQSGFDVSLYDKNNHIGGKVNRLETEGFGFDLGPSILTMPYIFENLFNYSDKQMKDYVIIERLPLQWRSFFTNGEVIDLYEDLSQMLNANTYLTNDDIQQLHQFLNYAEKIHRFTEKGYFALGLDKVSEIIKYQGLLRSLKGVDYFSTMQQAINRYIEKQKLRDMLGYFIKYVGSSSYDAQRVLTLLIHMQYEQGLWYVKGGIHKLAQALEQLAIEEGVAIHTGMDVCSIDTYFNHITGVRLDDGSHVSADYIVSNREVIPTYRDLLHFSNKK